MTERNRNPEFAAKAAEGRKNWPPERIALKRAQMAAQNLDSAFQARKLAGIAKRPPRGFTIPNNTHPCVRGFFTEANEQRATRRQISQRVSLGTATLTSWRTKCMPTLDNFDAALNALGFELAIVPIGTRDQNGFATKKPATPKPE